MEIADRSRLGKVVADFGRLQDRNSR